MAQNKPSSRQRPPGSIDLGAPVFLFGPLDRVNYKVWKFSQTIFAFSCRVQCYELEFNFSNLKRAAGVALLLQQIVCPCLNFGKIEIKLRGFIYFVLLAVI